MSEVERWLEGRLAGAPPSLRERILAAVQTTDVQRATYTVQRGGSGHRPLHVAHRTLHEQLKAVGDGLLQEVRSAPASRDKALTLLAADALMTFACEAIAELDPVVLAELR